METRVYSSASAISNPRELWASMRKDIGKARPLAYRLAVRDIKAQYRQTALGFVWAFLLPIVNTLTWLMLNGSGVVKMSETGIPYPVYVLSGTFLWAIFTESLNAPLQQTAAAKSMLKKINFLF
jgi:lipopolysaccharide transport system permease protein